MSIRPDAPRQRPRWWALAEVAMPFAALAWFGAAWLERREFVLVDDAYISFRYARNLAEGHGPVWNVGERVEGYTNPLWILLLTPFARLGLDLTAPGVLASFVFAAATLVVQRQVVRAAIPDAGVFPRLLPGMLLATNPSWAHAGTSAMETSCFAFFTLAAQFCLVRSREEPRRRVPAILCFCAAYLTRPEGALVAAVALAVELVTAPGDPSARLRRLVPMGVALSVVIGAHVAFRLQYYGYPLPNTFYAKVIPGPVTRSRGVAHVLAFLRAGGWVVLPGLVETFRRSSLRAYLVHGYALLFTYIAYLVFVGGDHPFWFRFYVPLLPLPLIATTLLVGRLARTIGGRLGPGVPARFRLPTELLAALGLSALVGRGAYENSEKRDVIGGVKPGYSRVIYDIAVFLRLSARPGTLIGALPVGYVGYYVPEVWILDMWGLNDVHTAHLDIQPNLKFGHDKFDMDYVKSLKLDYTLVFRPPQSLAAPKVPGYDVCWPSMYPPFAVYRRAYPLAPGDEHLGVPPGVTRLLPPPPRCRPPPPPQVQRGFK